jgi:DNA-binding GntR family transcriptional regulator
MRADGVPVGHHGFPQAAVESTLRRGDAPSELFPRPNDSLVEELVKQKSGGRRVAAGRQQPTLYALVTDVLRKALHSGAIGRGSVILEGPVAEILHCTRTPVRQALAALEEERLVSRFEGRGYLAGSKTTVPHRVKLTAAMLGVDTDAETVRKAMGWEAIQGDVERDVVHLSLFGRYRVNEVELARYFGVGRAVAHEVLMRLERLGLLQKDERLRWMIIPFDTVRINQLYELRWLLEPAALRAALASGRLSGIEQMTATLCRAQLIYPDISAAALDDLESDLHVRLLSHCPNIELLKSLERTRCVLTLSKHVLGVSVPMPELDPFMAEHLHVLEALSQQDAMRAEGFLRQHLEESCLKVSQRAQLVRDTFATPFLPYVS